MVNSFKVIVSGFVKNKNGQLLVIRRSLDEESFGGMLAIPGGTIEVEESDQLQTDTVEENLIREIKEETNIDVSVGSWIESTCMAKDGKAKLYIFFECEMIELNNTDTETSDETPEVFWADMATISLDECTPTLKKYIEANLQ